MSGKKRIAMSLALLGLIAAPLLADWNTGVAAFKAGDLESAESHFRGVIDMNPDWPGGHLMLGQTLLRGARVKEAVPFLERAVELGPGDLGAALALGQAYVVLKRFGAAAELLGRRQPHTLANAQKTAFYKTRAVARIGSGNKDTALEDLERAVALAPGNAELHRLLAQIAEAAGRRDLAIRHGRRLVELESDDVEALLSLSRLLYARALEVDPEDRAAACLEAAPYARRLAELDGGYDHLVLHARTLSCAGLYEEAQAPLLAASVSRPDAWWPTYQLGRTEIQLGRWAEAELAFELALANEIPEADEPRVRRNLGYAYERLDQLDDALDQYRLANDAEGIERVERNLAAGLEEKRLRELAEEAKRLENALAELEGSAGGVH